MVNEKTKNTGKSDDKDRKKQTAAEESAIECDTQLDTLYKHLFRIVENDEQL